MVQVVEKDSKARILEQFQQVLADRKSLAAKVETREEEAERAQNRQVVEAAAQHSTDRIVRGLADLQLTFNQTVGDLSDQLGGETTKLRDLKRAIAIEADHLQELQQTRVVADALYILTQEHQAQLGQLEQQAVEDREALEKEIAATRKGWQQEQEEYDALVADRRTLMERDRQGEEADYDYENERSRKIETDEYEQTQRQVEREIQETTQAKEKDWGERNRILDQNQPKLEEYRQKAEAFPEELDAAVKKAREDAIRETNQAAKVKADLYEKEWEATQQGYELQIQSLETKVERQIEQISDISQQLQAAVRQAQEAKRLAIKFSAIAFDDGLFFKAP